MKKIAVLAVVCLATAWTASAQTITGAFTGTLTDSSGAVLPNVRVTATNTATNVTFDGVTNSSGLYNLLFLPVGEYNLSAELTGFKKAQLGPFRLEVNQIARVDVKMEVGDASQSVNVDAAAPVLQTESTQTGNSLGTSQLTSLPLNGRNFAALTIMIPGAITTDPKAMNTSARVQGSGSRPFVNGNREQTNNFLLDGVDVNDSIDNRIAYQPNVDALEEVKVVTGNAAADYGNAGGAVVVMSMKSGTNELHGNVFEFFRNNVLDANGYFRNRNASTGRRLGFKRNIFGGTLGGPVVKNKVFFFVDYEGTIQREGGPASSAVAPAAWRTGDLSSIPTTVRDPLTGNPFPGNRIPESRITNPVARTLFSNPSLYPLPNQAGTGSLGVVGNYAGGTATKTDNHQADAKGDFRLSDKDNLSARWSIARYEQLGSQLALPIQMPGSSSGPTQSAVLNWVRTISPSIVNEARMAYSRFAFDTGVVDWSGQLGADGNAKFGIPGGQPFAGVSSVNLGQGLTGVGSAASIESTVDNKIMYYDNMTWQKGRHLMKMGGQFTRYQQNRYYAGNNGALGLFTYDSTYSGLDYADFLMDQLHIKGRGAVVGKWGQRSWRSALFFQDDFKVTSTLTFNLGLRWEYMQPLYEVADRQVNIDTYTGQVMYAGQNGNSRALYNGYWKQFMPRFGFAWTPAALNNKMVVRGGYAYMSFMEGTGANLRLPMNPPFFTESNVTYDGLRPGSITTGFADVVTTGVTLDMQRPPAAGINPQLQGRAWDQNLRPQTTQQINLSVEYMFDKATSLTAGYVGQRGRHLVAPHEANNPVAGTGPFNTWAPLDTRRPLYNLLPNVNNIALTEASATMDYNSLQVSGRRRFAAGLEFLASYTFGKTLTDNAGYYGGGLTTSDGAYWQDAYCRTCNRGLAFYNVAHSFTVGGLYSLPWGAGRAHTFSNKGADLLLGGWGINYFVNARSGFPITVRAVDRSSRAPRGNVRANAYRDLAATGPSTIDDYFGLFPSGGTRTTPFCAGGVDNGQCAYGQPADGALGNAGIATEQGPSYFNMDISIGKKFNISERRYFDFRVEAFNLLNHASWANPTTGNASIQNVGTFGNITSQVQSPRNIQFGLKYIF